MGKRYFYFLIDEDLLVKLNHSSQLIRSITYCFLLSFCFS